MVCPSSRWSLRQDLRSISVSATVSGTVAVASRPSGDESAPWQVLNHLDVTPVEPTTGLGLNAPAVDGTYDLRASLRTVAGAEVHSEVVPAALTVETPTSATMVAPAGDIYARPGQWITAGISWGNGGGGAFRLMAKPHGAPEGDFTPLELATQRAETKGGTQSPVVFRAPAALGDHDLRLDVHLGGHTWASSPVTDGNLHVVEPEPAEVAFASPTSSSPVTIPASSRLDGEVTVSAPGSIRVEYRKEGAPGWLTGRTVQASEAGTYGFSINLPARNATWDLRAIHTDRVGGVVSTTELTALTTFTGVPNVTIASPTSVHPAALTNDAATLLEVEVLTDTAGEAEIDIREQGTEAWVRLVGRERVDRPGGTARAWFTTGELAGTYDVRVTVTNLFGEVGEDVRHGALQLSSAPPTITVLDPAEGVAYDKPAGGASRLRYRVDAISTVEAQVKPVGSPDESYTTVFTQEIPYEQVLVYQLPLVDVPSEPGEYDLRLVATNVNGDRSTIERPGLYRVSEREPRTGVVISEYSTRLPESAASELFELANSAAAPVDVSGWSLEACSSGSRTTTLATIPAGTTLAAGERYLLASPDYPGAEGDSARPLPDQRTSSAVGTFDGLRIRDAEGRVVDGVEPFHVGYGCGEGEGVDPIAYPYELSVQRSVLATDTDDNASDFRLGEPTPQGRGTFLPTVAEAPTEVVGVAGDGEVALSWSAPADDGGLPVAGYVVTPHVEGVAQEPIVVEGGEVTSLVVAGLANGTSYTFTVSAVNEAGTGAPSEPSSPGIAEGYPDGSFGPGGGVARQAMAAFLYRFAHEGAAAPACEEAPFSDVPVEHRFCGEIAWLASSGIAEGYADGTFGVSQVVTRQAMAAFLHRVALV